MNQGLVQTVVPGFSPALERDEAVPATSTGLPTARMGMLIFLISESMMFVTLIAAYLVLRGSQSVWPPAGQPRLNVPMTLMNTFFLVSSSFTFHAAELGFLKGYGRKFVCWLSATILLGLLFLGIQLFEFRHLAGEGLSLSSSTFGSVFFTLTGFHGLHVLVGTVLMFLLLARMVGKDLTTANHAFVENVGLYWHFVDGVWVVLFTALYLY